jgi:ParB family chromosome partitioning protein
VLSAQEADEADGSLVLEDMRTPEGEPVPVEEWPNLSGVALIVTEDWEYPEPEATEGEDDADDADAYEYAEPVKVYRLLWVVTDIEASGLVHRSRVGRTDDDQGDDAEAHDPGTDAADEAEAEARRQERRRVIANNKAWASAETVRREWLSTFVARKTAPKGAEALICEAVVTGHHTLSKAMEHRHPRLFGLLGIDVPSGYCGAGYEECHKIATRATSPKGAIMTTLAAVVAAWEDSIGKHTWRNPSQWDTRMLAALMEWGYKPSDVERVLIGEEPSDDSVTDDEAEAVENDASTDAA